jgi:hypothetical protein
VGIYDNDVYGLGRYGPDVIVGPYPGAKTTIPVVDFAYLLPATAANVIDYNEVQITWGNIDNSSLSTVTEFRLLSNQWGFPVDENDGTILVDVVLASTTVPVAYNDTSVTPGKMAYYGIYMLVTGGVWVRSGFAACLVPYEYDNGARLLQLLPEYFRSFGANSNTVPQPPVPVIPPAIPASGQQISNPYGFDVNVYITGTLTGLIVNGVKIGVTNHFILLGGGSVTLNFPYPMWQSGSSYVVGASVIYSGNSYICTTAITDSTVPPATDGAHWHSLIPTPFPTWTPGLTWQSGSIVIYNGNFYEANYQVVASSIAPSIDTDYWTNIDPEPVEWEWTKVAPEQTDTFLQDYLNVVGFGLDYLRTQYDFELAGLNNPMKMSLGDLQDFCEEIGMPFSTELPAYTMRKAALYWAQVMIKRGTLEGIAEHVSLFSGYDVDLSLSRNFLLDDDMSVPIDPPIPNWSAGTKYSIGDKVIYPVADTWNILSTYPVGAVVEFDGLLYTATAQTQGVPPTVTADWAQNVLGPFTYVAKLNVTSLPGPAPSGSPTELDPTHTWYPIYGSWDGGEYVVTAFTIPPMISLAGTWENLRSDGTPYGVEIGVGYPDALTWNEATAGATSSPPNLDSRTYRAYNTSGTNEVNAWVRSIGRSEDDIIDDPGTHVPDPQIVVQHGTPLPRATPWSATTTYHTGDVTQSNGSYFVAQRGSEGSPPPFLGQPANGNPYFASSLTGSWTAASGTATQVSSPSLTGHAMTITYAGTDQQVYSDVRVPVIPGATYVFTGYAYTTSANQQPYFSATTYDAFGNYVNSYSGTRTTIATSTWTLETMTVVTDVSAASMSVNVNGHATSGTVNVTWGSAVVTCVATPEWVPMGLDNRMHVVTSAYTLSDIGTAPTAATTVTPFSEFYDDWGNFIGRCMSRTFSGDYLFDSFSVGSQQPVPVRQLDTGGIWTVPEGALTVTPAQDVRAAAASTASIGIVQVPAASMQALTFTAGASVSLGAGLLFWYSDTGDYWYAGETALYYSVSGTMHHGATYTGSTLSPGDRVYVWTNNTTSVQTIPGSSVTIQGPSIVVWKNQVATADILVAMSASPTGSQVAFPSPTPYKPSTTPGTLSYAGIIAEAATA